MRQVKIDLFAWDRQLVFDVCSGSKCEKVALDNGVRQTYQMQISLVVYENVSDC
jgi:hypothetical protein